MWTKIQSLLISVVLHFCGRTSLSGVDLAVDVTSYLFASVGLRLDMIFQVDLRRSCC